MRNLLLYIILAGTLFSCLSEKWVALEEPEEETAEVTFHLKIPAVGKTRAVADEPSYSLECKVETIDVLAFRIDALDGNKEKYAYHARGHTIKTESEPDQISFRVTLLRKTEPHRFVLIVNAGNELNQHADLTEDKLKEDLLSELTFTHLREWETVADPGFTLFPMWGESNPATITDQTSSVTGIRLLRMVCRLDVAIAGENAQSVFTLESVRLYNRKTRGRIVPDVTNLNISTGQVIKATMPDDPQGDLTSLLPTNDYYRKINAADTSITNIYTFETGAPLSGKADDATCLVIGGKFENSPDETFYRVDFTNAEHTEYRDFLRNHHYAIIINEVLGEGYKDPDEAFNGQSMNLVGEIIHWNEKELSDIVFFGPYYISVGKDKENKTIRVEPKAGSSSGLQMKTNIELKNLSMWFLPPYDQGSRQIANGIENDRFRVQFILDSQDHITQLKVTAKQDYDSSDPAGNEQELIISGHRVEMTIYIIQMNSGRDDWADGGEFIFDL